jgi:hypothetical protein
MAIPSPAAAAAACRRVCRILCACTLPGCLFGRPSPFRRPAVRRQPARMPRRLVGGAEAAGGSMCAALVATAERLKCSDAAVTPARAHICSTHAHTHTLTCIRTHTHTHAPTHARTHTHSLTHSHAHTRLHTLTLTHAYTRLHTHTLTLAHTQTHARAVAKVHPALCVPGCLVAMHTSARPLAQARSRRRAALACVPCVRSCTASGPAPCA